MDFSTTSLLVTLLTVAPLHSFQPGSADEKKPEASYKGQPASYWRSQMKWPDTYSNAVADRYPLLLKPDPEAIPVLLEILREDNFKVQWTALRCISELGKKGRPALTGLCEILDDQIQGKKRTNQEVLQAIIGILGRFEKDVAVTLPRFRKLRKDPEASIRLAAAGVLWEITREKEPYLEIAATIVKDPGANDSTRDSAVRALAKVGGATPETIRLLIFVLDKDPADYVRREAAVALGQFGKAAVAAMPALLRRLDDPGVYVRREALEAILRIGAPPPQVLPHVLRELKADNVWPDYLDVLKRWKPIPPQVVAAVEALLQRPRLHSSVKEAATEFLQFARSQQQAPTKPR